jgi:preprotein translocase subunit YajC
MNQLLILMSPPAGQSGQGGIMSFLPLIAIVVVFYFFMIRPQMKKAKDQKKYIEALKKGDQILTIGGIYGKIVEVKDDAVIDPLIDNAVPFHFKKFVPLKTKQVEKI